MNKRKYRQAISKLSEKELRDALVREAVLREAAHAAIIGLQQEIHEMAREIQKTAQQRARAAINRSALRMFRPVKIKHG